MSQIIHDKAGNAFELTTSEEARGRTDAAMEFKTVAEVEAFVRRLGETAEGRAQLRRMVEEVAKQADNNEGIPPASFNPDPIKRTISKDVTIHE